MIKAGQGDDPGLYVHVPFCARACPYCDFDFVVERRPDAAPFLGGLAREIEARGLAGQRFDTLYVGGGTPSALGAEGVAALAELLGATFDLGALREFTVEVNPEHVDDGLVAALGDAGVDRLSIGVQSLDDTGLVQLGRVHDQATARDAIARCVAAGLQVSADLIVGWPGQSTSALEADIAGILDAGASHLSIYGLTIESGTPWEALVRRGTRALPDPDKQAALLAHAHRSLTGRGAVHYEIASYGLGGHRARHNTKYWRWTDYVGLGPSAHSASYDPEGAVIRRGNQRGLANWLRVPSLAQTERLDPVAAAAEGLWLGLRQLEGIDVAAFLGRFPSVGREWVEARVAPQVARGNLAWSADGARLAVHGERWLFHDEISVSLIGP